MMNSSESSPQLVRRKNRTLLWNILTVLALLTIGCLLVYFFNVYRDPQFALNPFKPIPTATVYSTETPTITPIQQQATWTPTVTLVPSATRTRAPSWTPLPEQRSVTPTPTSSLTLTPSITTTPMPAVAEFTYLAGSAIHPGKTCDWTGVGGVVLDTKDSHLQFQTIQLGGKLGELTIEPPLKAISGSVPAFGTSGFEFDLGDQPVDSTQTLWIQLFDNTGQALTEKIYFDTFSDCTKNLVKVTFKRIR